MGRVRIGLIGCGNISGIYCKNFRRFRQTEVSACADLDLDRARAVAAEYGVPWSGAPEELLARDDVDLVVNLTVPGAHYAVARAALAAGKGVYGEKPFAVELAEGEALLAAARDRGCAIGGAPDTFLGAGLQTCRKLIDEGAIGEPVGFSAFMLGHGVDGWHPDPAFFYRRGGGPLFDMGPYYLTALVSLLGPVERVVGMARASFEERLLTTGARAGTRIPVETPTHIVAGLQFRQGAIGQLCMSFDVWHHNLPWIEIYGSDATLSVPDPNGFGGEVRVRRAADSEWEPIAPAFRFAENSRGLGALDLALAHRDGRPARAGGELAFHVLETMHAALASAERGSTVAVRSAPERPAPMPADGPDDDI